MTIVHESFRKLSPLSILYSLCHSSSQLLHFLFISCLCTCLHGCVHIIRNIQKMECYNSSNYNIIIKCSPTITPTTLRPREQQQRRWRLKHFTTIDHHMKLLEDHRWKIVATTVVENQVLNTSITTIKFIVLLIFNKFGSLSSNFPSFRNLQSG